VFQQNLLIFQLQAATKSLVGSNLNGTAYKPAVATPLTKTVNGKSERAIG
jgi:hypothetical protein